MISNKIIYKQNDMPDDEKFNIKYKSCYLTIFHL